MARLAGAGEHNRRGKRKSQIFAEPLGLWQGFWPFP